MTFRFFKVAQQPDSEILDLLNNNIIGTPGFGMLYQHMGVRNKLFKIPNPFFIKLDKRNKTLGVCCFCARTSVNNGRSYPAFYIRYFSFLNSYRKKQLTEKATKGNSILRKEIDLILAGQGLSKNTGDKFFHYAYVDPRNMRSVRLCAEFGMERVREYTTVIFHRMKPKASPDVIKISHSQESVVREILRNFYKSYTMFSFENLFNGRNYYVIKNANDKIVAGVSVNPENWKIHSMPGLLGNILINTFSHLPYLRRVLDKNYQFLTLEGIYYSPGYENCLETLFETLLARYNLHSAIICVDPETPLYQTLSSLKLGIVAKLNKEVRGNVICRFINFSEDEKQIFKSQPAYISGIDVT